ncbi:sulfatase [Blastopirellula marina]|uniref:Arylsulfatase n=1 Tax=Blastopirellula marina TaxID=124 RepID=A0A2S8G8S3_9BACT|nr:sulfatase [Blastopirellula marina]PQO40827.1 arylsulfatase [Blastopirellula marina]PTL45709.1 arylsulfatase [Blastopirellula marina]
MNHLSPTHSTNISRNLRHKLTTLLLIASATTLAFCPIRQAVSAEKERTPNIVLIFIDDMGYADIGPFGAKAYQTPNLDKLAAEGRTFTDFYVPQAVCSASRAGLMTGCYNVRVGIQGALGPNAKIGINPNEMTMAELCKQKGYATACYGKWHLGDRQPFLPLQNGFDDYFGLPYSNDMWPYHPGVRHLSMEERVKRWPHLPLYDKNEVVNAQVDDKAQEQLTTQYTEKAVSFIEKNKDRPFFLYVPHSMVHVPLYVSDKFKGKSGAGLFGDVVMEVDWSVGQIVDALHRNKLDDNTLVIFTADNGPWLSYGDHAGSAGPLREGKGTMWEGGCREPTIMKWPGKIPAGTVCHTPAMTIDIFPTVAKLIGAKLPDHPIDGKDIWPLMTDQPGAKSPHEAYYFYYGSGLKAVRSGKWKLVFPHEYRTLNGRPGGTGGIPTNYQQATTPLALFDLEADPGETKNLVEDHPDVVQRLENLADRIRAKLGDSHRKIKGKENRPPGRV